MNEPFDKDNQPQDTKSSLGQKLRRKLLKVLALGERARVAVLMGFESMAEGLGKARAAVARHPISPLLYLAVAAVAVGALTIDGMYARAYVLKVDGVEVGVVADEGDVEAIVAHVETRAASILGEDYDYDGNIEVTPALAPVDEFSDITEVENTVFASVGALVEAYAISVNGVELGYAPTLEDMEGVLDRIAAPYLTEDTTDYDFLEEVEIFPVELPANTEYDLEGLYATLTVCTVEEARYTIQRGDTFNKIAYGLGMTPAELSALNPDVVINKIYVGQELVIQQAVPFLSTRTYANETYEQVVDSPVEYIETANLYVGNTSVKEQGTDGLALVNADATYINGVEVERTVITSETLVEPTTTYMYTGTTPRPRTASNGYFIWPLSGTLTSGYGNRYIFGSYSFHSGIDIAAPYGSTVKAADGGTVTYAGWRGSYGILVIITHDNGSQTYYGHNSSLLVSAGTKVYQGQAIARVGMTGTATGYHCHFEVRINGRSVNPFNYL